jgi:hypothetical protein
MSASFGDPRIPERIWNKVELIPFSTCWWWVATTNQKGYGRAWIGGKLVGVHRHFYETFVGLIPEGLQLDHFACPNPGCCNPAHVRPVTPRENSLRSDTSRAAINLSRTHCKCGREYDSQQKTGRTCSACNARWVREAGRRYYARQKAQGA